MNKNNKKKPLEYTINVNVLPATGFKIDMVANAEERIALAVEADVLEIKSLKAELVLRRWRKEGVGVKGRIFASVIQECVITLEPVECEFIEEIERTFLPEGSRLAKPRLNDDGEMVIDFDGADIPDMFIGGQLDVWEIILEHLQLGLDPYPRAVGAELLEFGENIDEKLEETKASPFAALSALKDKK